METIGIISWVLILFNIVVSYNGLKDNAYFNRYSFNIPQLRLNKDYKRLITSGFLHGSWTHLIFNMVALYSFGVKLENFAGGVLFGLIYFSALVGGNLLSLYIHRNKSNYSASGASGAISGIIFACIAISPNMNMGLLFIPGLTLPGWIFGLLYVAYSIFGVREQRDNIGHDAHLGGGIIGLVMVTVLFPEVLASHYLTILLLLIPSLAFLYFIFTNPVFLLVKNPFSKPEGVLTIEDRYNASKRTQERELDFLLDKIGHYGIESLSKKEKERLEHLSKVKK
jgi:membrane associated rhomboid family serine protease